MKFAHDYVTRQAQFATYADAQYDRSWQQGASGAEQLTALHRKQYIFRNISKLASEDTFLHDTTYDDFQDFLRHGEQEEDVHTRAHYLQAYAELSPLFVGIKQTDLGGSEATIGKLAIGAKTLAVKTMKSKNNLPAIVVDRIIRSHGILARGLPHYESLVAADYDAGIAVTDFLPGKTIAQLIFDKNNPTISHIPDEHLQDFGAAVASGLWRGVGGDWKHGNVLYDAASGFYRIDYQPTKTPPPASELQDVQSLMDDIPNHIAFDRTLHQAFRDLGVVTLS